MSSQGKILVAIVIAVAVVGGGAYAFFSKPIAAPSAPIEKTVEALPSEGEHSDDQADAAKDPHAFYVVADESEVSFTMTETLRGEPVTVVGTTNQVSGEVAFDAAHPQQAQVGAIKINARTLVTDSQQRNGAISRLILQSEKPEYEFITFTPSKIEGLPTTAKVGDSFNVTITGSLKIRDISKDIAFAGTVVYSAENTLKVDVSGVVKRADFSLNIPNLPFLADLQEEVTLKAKLTAKREAVAMDHGAMKMDAETTDTVKQDAHDTMVNGVHEITVTGSNFAFAPSALTVKKGEKVRLTFKNSGGNHDFVIDELGVSTKLLKSGDEQVVEFTPSKTGTFEYYCSVGNHRAMGMKGTIIVQ